MTRLLRGARIVLCVALTAVSLPAVNARAVEGGNADVDVDEDDGLDVPAGKVEDPDEIAPPDARPRAHDEIPFPDAKPRDPDEIPYPNAKPPAD
ncbi:MAG: hypothetical protein AB7V27_02310 [Candidatus Binatia bacterium]